MFKKNDQIIYPVYGAGIVKKVYNEEFDGEKKEYLEIDFPDTKVVISVPRENAEKLGMRYPNDKKDLKKILKELKAKEVETEWEDINSFDTYTNEKLSTGSIEDMIEVINLMFHKKEDKGKLTLTESQKLEKAVKFVRSEVGVVMGDKTLGKYESLELKE